MYVVAVTVFVKPADVDSFALATLENARNTRREAGNARFDVLRSEDDPTRFLLYEAYHAKDGTNKAVGRNFILPDGSRLFLGGSAPGGTQGEKK